MTDIRNNLRATGFPTVTDNSSLTPPFSQGSFWYYKGPNGGFFECRDATPGAAIWDYIGPGSEETVQGSGQTWYPDNFVSSVDVTPGTTFDLVGFYPFIIRRPVASMGLWLRTLGAGSKAMFSLYAHDRTTGKPGARVANFGETVLDSATGFRTTGALNLDLKGLYWGRVGVKLNGQTAPTYVGMNAANGKYIHRTDGTDLSNNLPIKAFSSHDTYTTTPADPASSTSAINELLPLVVLRSA